MIALRTLSGVGPAAQESAPEASETLLLAETRRSSKARSVRIANARHRPTIGRGAGVAGTGWTCSFGCRRRRAVCTIVAGIRTRHRGTVANVLTPAGGNAHTALVREPQL